MPCSCADLPEAVRRHVETSTGPVVDFQQAARGYSGGVLGVVTGLHQAAFVKAVPHSSAYRGDYEIEARVRRALPVSVPAPALYSAGDAGDWFVIVSAIAEGRLLSEPVTADDLAAALSAFDDLARQVSPSPIADLPSVADRMHNRTETWRALQAGRGPGPLDLTDWERHHLARLAHVEQSWTGLVVGDSLLHFDPRFDNLMVGPDGRVSLLDWGRACVGPAWVDHLCLLLQSDIGTLDPEHYFRSSATGRSAPRDAVDGFLVALAGYWRHAAALPADPGTAELRSRQAMSAATTIRWLARRWDTRHR